MTTGWLLYFSFKSRKEKKGSYLDLHNSALELDENKTPETKDCSNDNLKTTESQNCPVDNNLISTDLIFLMEELKAGKNDLISEEKSRPLSALENLDRESSLGQAKKLGRRYEVTTADLVFLDPLGCCGYVQENSHVIEEQPAKILNSASSKISENENLGQEAVIHSSQSKTDSQEPLPTDQSLQSGQEGGDEHAQQSPVQDESAQYLYDESSLVGAARSIYENAVGLADKIGTMWAVLFPPEQESDELTSASV